jgi:tRNA (guanine37-N1)-methyltransferase
MAGYDMVGNIVVFKFVKGVKVSEKKRIALKFLEEHKAVLTALEKIDKFKGRLRVQKTSWIAGEKTKEVLYKENDCVFRFNVDTCYFSPRLSSERKEVAEKVRLGEKVLVMFGGVAPFAIIIAKASKAEKVVSVELGRECNKYAQENVKRNKLQGKVEIVGGDVKRVLGKDGKVKGEFDRIVMTRPNLKDSFLDLALLRIKEKGIIHYYGFYELSDEAKMKDMIKSEASKARRKIRILKVKKAGEVGIKKYRWRVDIRVE